MIIRLCNNYKRKKEIVNLMRYYLQILNDINAVHLHYGYFKNFPKNKISNRMFVNAQNNLSKFIISQLKKIKPHGNVLDIGGGIGGISNDLLNEGYNPLCITPDNKLIQSGMNKFPNVKFCISLAESLTINKKFDVAFMIESFQFFINKGKALKNIVDSMNKNSIILIIDEFANPRTNSKYLPIEKIYKNTLMKRGYAEIINLDLSKQILPTFDFLYSYIIKSDSERALSFINTKNEYLSNKRKYKLIIMIKNEKINKKH